MATEQGRDADGCDGYRDSVGAGPAGSIRLQFDMRIYSVDAILRTAYKFTDAYYVWLEREAHSTESCLVFIRAKRATASMESVSGEFSNELIDQRLRERLEQQFGQLRTLITAQAFSEGNLLDPASCS